MGKVKIKQNWDSPIRYAGRDNEDEFVGYFVGREKEVSLLSNDIRRKNEGSILVRGHPGVGKTSLVMRALQLASDESIIPTFLSGPDMVGENGLTPESMMRHLARRLYVYTKDRNLDNHNERIQEFYLKAVSQSRDIRHTEKEEINVEEQITEKGVQLNLAEWNAIIKYLIHGVPFVIGALTSFTTFSQTPVIPVIVTAILLIPFHLFYRRVTRYTQQRKVRHKAETVYEKDNTLGNLKFDLNEIHRELDDERIVYIIDELDKVKLGNARKTLEFFKDFFTASNAIFIFVGGELFKPENFTDQRDQDAFRPRSYTYFDSEYFISRPRREDLIRFLDEIIQEHSFEEDDKLDVFMRALCFESRNDFFDLKSKIKNRISIFGDDNIILEPKSGDEQKANFYDAVSAFEEKYFADPSRWEENEKIARRLFDVAYTIFDGHVEMEIEDPEGTSVLDQVERNFHQFLHRHGVLTVQTSDTREIEGVDVPVNTYVVDRTEISHAPGAISEPTEFERQFAEKFKRLCAFHLPIVNLLRQERNQDSVTDEDLIQKPKSHLEIVQEVGINTANQIDEHLELFRKIQNKDTRDLNRQNVEKSTDNIDSIIQSLKNNRLIQGFLQAYEKICINQDIETLHLNDIRGHLDSVIGNQYEGENPQVLFSEATKFSQMRLAIFSTEGTIPRRNVKRFLKDSDKYRIVISTDGNIDNPAVIYLNTDNPTQFQDSCELAVAELEEFYLSGLREEVESILTNGTVKTAQRELEKLDESLLDHAFEYEKRNHNRISLLRWLGKRRS